MGAYDDTNKLIETIPPSGASDKTRYEYDPATLKQSKVIEPDGDTWTWAYVSDETGAISQMTATDPLQRQTTTTYTALHQPDTVTGPRGEVTDYSYDANGNLTQIVQPDGVTTAYGYNANGKLTSTTDPNGKTTTFNYGVKGNLTKVTDPLGKATNLTYDSSGRLTEKKDPRQNIWTYGYNTANQLTSVDPPLMPATTYTYSKVGQVKTVTDAKNQTTTYTYDGNGRLLTIKAPNNSIVASYAYWKTGQVKTAKDANNHVTTYTYDDDGRLEAVEDPLDRVWEYTYWADGSLKPKTLPSTDTIDYAYFADGQIKGVTYSNAITPDVSFTYDSGGRTATMTDGAGTVSYGYDDLNRITTVTRGADAFGYTYLPGGQLDVVTYPGGATVDHDYRDDSRVDDITVDSQTTTYGYDDSGNLSTISLPNGITTTYTWDAANRLTNVEHKKGANVLQNHAITQFDSNGNPKQIVGPSGTTNYTYDLFDRLSTVCTPSCTGGSPSGITYTYDLAGNRATEVRHGPGGGTTTYNYDAADQLTSTSGFVAKTYTYDDNGNQTAAGNRSFTYDSENRMLTTTQGGTTTAYAYDGSGNMLSRSVGGSPDASFLWDTNAPMSQLAIERDGSGAELRRFTYGPGGPGGLLAMYASGANRFYLADGLGSVGATSSPAGALEWTYGYEGYGTPTATQVDPSGPANPMAFHGQYQEPSGLFNMRARQYDASSGRFLGVDPAFARAPGGRLVSTYAYGFNQPSVLTDPSGMAPDSQALFSRALEWFNVNLNPGYAYLESCFGSDGTQSLGSWLIGCGTGSAFLAVAAAAPFAGRATTNSASLPFRNAGLRSQVDDVSRHVDEFGVSPQEVAQGAARGHPVGTYLNKSGALPSRRYGYYVESEVWPSGSGVKRTADRLVFGSGGEVYYSPTHYGSFVRIR